jgi:antitoxin HigA-1
MARLKPIHPGEILLHEFMVPLKLNANQVALALHVPAPGIYDIVKGERGISSDMALRLARGFNTTADFWMNLQTRYDLLMARGRHQRRVNREVRPIRKAVA